MREHFPRRRKSATGRCTAGCASRCETGTGSCRRACLTYDLTFFVLLCNSLHEPAETQGTSHCVMHPAPAAPAGMGALGVDRLCRRPLRGTRLPQGARRRGRRRRSCGTAAERLLAGAYERARARIPEQCAEIERAMAAIRAIEGAERNNTPALSDSTETACVSPLSTDATDAAPVFDPDAAAREFGRMLGRLFAHNQGFWTEAMEELGRGLGRFIYLMDAAVDFANDARTGSYNPFVTLGSDADACAPRWPLPPPMRPPPTSAAAGARRAPHGRHSVLRRLGPVQQSLSAPRRPRAK